MSFQTPTPHSAMTLLALGLNHQTAPVSLREQVAFSESALPAALASLRALDGVAEAVLVSTCNRTELYARTTPEARSNVADWLAGQHQIERDWLESYLYRHADAAAARHLYRVATGLDSLVLGEPQILGQVKTAWHIARDAGTVGSALDRLFQSCFATAKRVRTETRIGRHPVSVAFAAVKLAQQVFADLDRATVLLIGAGDTIELALRHLVDARARRLLVANRTLEHAQDLASRCGGYALPLSELGRHLAEADIVISATASRDPILDRTAVDAALRQRRRRPMFLLDLAVPRDIAPDVARLDDVYLYTVDDLEQVIEDNRRSRREAAEQAEAIIELQVEHFMAWWRGTQNQDALKRLRADAERLREQSLIQARQQLAAGRSPEEVLERLANTLTNRLLHRPSAALRDAAQRGDVELLRAGERLFDPGNGNEAGSESA